jgi:kanamycin kinase/aminoglycoside 3'-phosphotransferase-2
MNRIFKKHEERVDAPRLPADIAPFLHDYTFFKLVRNYPAPTNVYRAVRAGYPSFFLKVGRGLSAELERLSWLDTKLLIPKIVAYSTLENQEYLLLTEVAGLPADDEEWLANIASMVEVVAEGVRRIHSLPQGDCPFDASADALMAKAESVVRLQLLDPRDLSVAYRHQTIKDLFSELIRLFPANENIVFTHGDLCLPNILIQQGASVGFVDLRLAGLSDPHRDLALIVRSIRTNFGEKWLQLFFDAYCYELDERKIEFYTLLDQFTMERNYMNL